MGNKVSSIIFSTALNNKQLEKDLERTRRQIEKFEREIAVAENTRLPYVKQSEQLAAQLDLAQAKLYEMQNVAGGIFSTDQIAYQKETVKSLQAQFNKVQKTVENYDRKIQKATVALDEAKETAGDIEKRLTTAGYSAEKMSNAIRKADKTAENFRAHMREVARNAFLFSVISQALSAFKEWVVLVIKTNEEAISSVAQLKAALLTLAQPLVEILVPAFIKFINILTIAATVVGRLLAAVFGTSYEEAQKVAQSLNQEIEALNGVGSAAKKASGSLAGFDEINTITTETAIGTSVDFIAPDFSEMQELPRMLEQLLSELELKIKEIRFSWDKGEILKSKDAWIVALAGILGAVIGSMFGGLSGVGIGLIMGASIGIATLEFGDEVSNPLSYEDLFWVVLTSILGAVIGSMFGGLSGVGIGLIMGASIGIATLEFDNDMKPSAESKAERAFKTALTTIIGALIGATIGGVFGGIVGGVIGLTLGLAITLGDATVENKDINVTGKGMFGGEVSLNRSIPGLATGAVVPPNREFMAILGDNKRETEVVSPLSTMKQAMLEAMQESGFGGEITVTVVTNLDGREVARNSVRHINNMTRQAGKPVLLL